MSFDAFEDGLAGDPAAGDARKKDACAAAAACRRLIGGRLEQQAVPDKTDVVQQTEMSPLPKIQPE